jgi:hypothetical protein
LIALVSASGKVLVRLAGNGDRNLQFRELWTVSDADADLNGFMKAFSSHSITITHNPSLASACLWIQ